MFRNKIRYLKGEYKRGRPWDLGSAEFEGTKWNYSYYQCILCGGKHSCLSIKPLLCCYIGFRLTQCFEFRTLRVHASLKLPTKHRSTDLSSPINRHRLFRDLQRRIICFHSIPDRSFFWKPSFKFLPFSSREFYLLYRLLFLIIVGWNVHDWWNGILDTYFSNYSLCFK